jgi:hypothetical protein
MQIQEKLNFVLTGLSTGSVKMDIKWQTRFLMGPIKVDVK